MLQIFPGQLLEPDRNSRLQTITFGFSGMVLLIMAAGLLLWPNAPAASETMMIVPALKWEWFILALLAGMITYSIALNRRLERQRQQSQAAEQVFRELAEASADWVWQTNADGEFTEISPGFTRLTGQQDRVLLDRNWFNCPILQFQSDDHERLQKSIRQRAPVRGVICKVQTYSGEYYHVRVTGWTFLNEEGEFAGYRGFAIDNTALVAARDQVKFLNEHDTLTGLPNRTALTRRLNTLLQSPAKDRSKAALVSIDIDRFSSINEGYGTAAGDSLIRQFAEKIQEAFSEQDVICRYANDEFIILRERVSALDPLPANIARLRLLVEEPFEIGGERIGIVARMGIYECDGNESDAETFLKRVQIALAESKRDNQFVTIYAPGMDEHAQTLRRLEDDIPQALANDEFKLVFQPQMCLKTGQIISAEALMRWQHPNLGMVSPGKFIPVAEKAGLITELSLWALRQAGLALRDAQDMSIAVNISALDFQQSDLVSTIQHIVDDVGIDTGRIELEVTESVLISEQQTALKALRRLKKAGFSVALDDFGTGYAGLGYLQTFPFDKIKIDQSFVQRVDESAQAQAIIRSVTTLAHDIGLRVVAEGVERLSQIEQLKKIGCDVAQGYILGKPVSADGLASMRQGRSIGSMEAAAPIQPITLAAKGPHLIAQNGSP